MNKKVSSESVVRDIHRKTRKKYSSEEKIRIVLEGFQSRMSAIGRFLPIEAVRRTSALGVPPQGFCQIPRLTSP